MSILITSSLLLLLLWPACYALLRYSERYTLNRFLLVAAMVTICALPFVSLESPAPAISQSLQGTVTYLEQTVMPLPATNASVVLADLPAEEPVAGSGTAPAAETAGLPGVAAIYLFGLGFALLLLTGRLLFILALHLRSRPQNDGAYRLLHPGASSGQAFTFGPNVYFSEDVAGGADFDHALAHERVHARQAHSVDIVLSEVFLCLFWFHPAAWWLRTQLRANLEYLVDRAVLNGGVNKRNYQLALVRQSQGMHGLALALPFSEPSLKGRIERMTGLPKYRLIGILAAVVLTTWMGLAGMLVNGSTDNHPQALVPASRATPNLGELLAANTQADVAGIESFALYFRRLPTPYEFAQIQEILGVLDNTHFSIYHPCDAEEGEYALQLSHWLNVEAQTPFYLREGDLMYHHNVLKLKPNGVFNLVPSNPHASAGYFTPILAATVIDEKDPFSRVNKQPMKVEFDDGYDDPIKHLVAEGEVRLVDYRKDLVHEEIAVFINGERRTLESSPRYKVSVSGTDADKVDLKVNGQPVPTWGKSYFATWREVEAENGTPPVPANVRMYCLLGMNKNRSGLTRNVRSGHTGSSRAWFERIKLPEGREITYYLNDEVSTAAEVLDREFKIADVQMGYDCNDPNGPIIVQAIDDIY